jgi:hypothetical protein
MPTPSIDESRLGPMKLIDEGKFGQVFALKSFTLAGFSAALAYKRSKISLTPTEIDNVTALITYRAGLSSADRNLLDELSTWPLCLVTRGGEVVGFLMRLLDDHWFQTIRLGTGDKYQPRSASWLLADSASAARVGVAVPQPGGSLERLVLCAKLARVLALLHHGQLVYGDLNAKNVVFTLKPKPALVLLDCDAVKPNKPGGIRQPHQGMWIPPEGSHAPQTPETDCFKLTLFVIRCLAEGPRAGMTRDPDRVKGAVDDEGVSLLLEGISDDPGRRPTAKQIYSYLWDYLCTLTEPPRITNVTVSEQVVLSGTTIKIRCEVQGTDFVKLRGSDGFEVAHHVSDKTNLINFSITRSGPITISASNDYGSQVVNSPPVMVFSPPQLDFVSIPEPPIPYTDLGTDQQLSRAIMSSLEAQVSPAGASVALPPLPSVLLDDPARTASQLIPDVDLLPTVTGLSRVMDGLTEQADAISRALSTPLSGTTDIDALMSATLPPPYGKARP